jgi:hypothetical protein
VAILTGPITRMAAGRLTAARGPVQARTPHALALAVLALSYPPGCGATPGDVTFKIEVLGSVEALATYRVAATPIDAAPNTEYQFISRLPWTELPATIFTVTAARSSAEPSEVTLRPFVCEQDPMFGARLQSGKWKARETQQAFLMPDGSLEIGTDFDHLLSYRCDWASADGRSQSGSASLASTPLLCSEDGRKQTSVRLTGTLFGAPFDETPATCLVTLTDETPAQLTLVFGFDNADITLSASLQHCADPASPLPLVLSAPTDVPCSVRGAIEVASASSGKRYLVLVSGSWTIASLSFLKDGRLAGPVDAMFTQGSDSLSVVGTIDLPIMRVPRKLHADLAAAPPA